MKDIEKGTEIKTGNVNLEVKRTLWIASHEEILMFNKAEYDKLSGVEQFKIRNDILELYDKLRLERLELELKNF